MPRYRRRNYRSRPRRARRHNRRYGVKKGGKASWLDKPRTIRGMAAQAWSTGKWIAKMVNTEQKFHDNAFSLGPALAGEDTSLLDIAQGDTGVTRDGRSIRLKSVHCRYTMVQHASASSTFVRVCLIADTRPNAGEPSSVADFLQGGAGSNIFALPSKDVGGRYVTLYDTVVNLSAGAYPGEQCFKKFYIPLDKVVKYTDSSTDDPQNYNLHMVAFSSEATNTPTIAGECRVTFIDN